VQEPIQTVRLTLRPFALEDLREAFGWFGDPLVMRYTPTGPDRDMTETATRIASYQRHQAEHGFSKWVIADQNSGRPIGDAGLLFIPDYGWVDFGYRLARSYWGRGLATEAASALMERAFGELKLSRLVSIVHPENRASIRVLDKLGFLEERRGVVMGMSCIVCCLTAPAYRDRESALRGKLESHD